MDEFHDFMDVIKRERYAQGNFLGLLNVLIGRRIADAQGKVISAGLTWRALAFWLKQVRWDKEAVRELGEEPRDLPPRDRERFWYHSIARAQVGSVKATQAGDRLAEALRGAGYVVGPAPPP
jgi:hypothetical protein